MSDEFEAHRDRCLGIAYRMLGSRADAEDVVQEASVRWLGARDDVREPAAWLTTTVTRLCLDHLKSARVRREQYVGPWLPEPVQTQAEDPIDPESISMAFLLVLERLSPAERAAFLLRQVFELDYGEVAAALERSEAATRQLVSRARNRLERDRPRYTPDREAHDRLLMGFLMAAQSGDVGGMAALLAEDVRAWSDSGGKARAARKLVSGRDPVARLFVGLATKNAGAGLRPELRELNGAPGLVVWSGDQLQSATTIETDGALIHAVHVVVNPDKLSRLASELVHA